MKVTILIIGAIVLFFVSVYFLISYIKDVKNQKLPFGRRKR
ncbi:TPA: small membrane protein [Klebsiella pneumoniae]|uniref:Small membrane protein n=1 Tax=Klebsiella pneumoniae TaxID=573 RepID=A0A6B2J1W4_KLEPN|nr:MULTISPECIES: small membrane protein [Klebsiella]MDE1573328.1 small membrane protein [Klebsiella pneumoniae]MDF9992024.1 small membrane protein [Klebsiella pneumoniae]MDS0275005.1 small membrane protein [Klebsiella quasipneumoniae]NDR63411.1 small membrane protein [Klebsiella pneumoniae]NDR83988.1 small membrane protein [Klebsiella pneumoniae]